MTNSHRNHTHTDAKYHEGIKEIVAKIKNFNDTMCEETLPDTIKNKPSIRRFLLIACVEDITYHLKADMREEIRKENVK